MEKNRTAAIALRASRRAAKNFALVGVVAGLTVVGFATAVSGAGTAVTEIISVDHTHKGDRLPLAPKSASKASSSVVTTLSRPPIGCESTFSRAADPKRSHIFGRCIS